MALLAHTFDVGMGVILEGLLTLPEAKGMRRRGLYIECGRGKGAAILVSAAGAVELGPIGTDGSGFKAEKKADRQIPFARPARFRLLLKGSLLEFYLDDVLIECFSLPADATGRIGTIAPGRSDTVRITKVWQL